MTTDSTSEFTIDLSGRNLKLNDENDVVALVEEINATNPLVSIRLSNTSIGVSAAQAIAEALRDHTELEVADFSDSFTGRLLTEIPVAVRSFGHALMDHTSLRVLDFSNNAFGPVGAKAVYDLVANNVHIEELLFVNNGLGIEGGEVLAAAVLEAADNAEATGVTHALKVFRAGRNRLENEGAAALAKAFESCGTLQEVALPQNGINHPGIAALFDAFESNPDLQYVDLNDNTFTLEGSEAAARVLPGMSKVKHLDFGDCLLTADGTILVADAIRSSKNQGLITVNLSYNDADTDGVAQAIAGMVSNQHHLEALDLRGNEMDRQQLEVVKSALDGTVGSDILEYSDEESDCSDADDEYTGGSEVEPK